jgi:integrase
MFGHKIAGGPDAASYLVCADQTLVGPTLLEVRFHDLRHGFATIALAAGLHPKLEQERLGHSSISVTMDVYSHELRSGAEEAAGVLTRAVEASREDPLWLIMSPLLFPCDHTAQ